MNQDYRYLAVADPRKPRWGRRLVQPILYAVVRTLSRTTIEGLDNLPAQGPVILIFNHIHAIDPFVTVALLPRYGVPISKIENYDIPLFGALIRRFGVIPIRRGEVDVRAIKACEAVLAAGHVLLMAPEGTRSRDASLQVGKEGLAFVARKSDPVIVPVAITGSTALTASFKRLRPVPVHLRYGTPFRFRWPEGKLTREHLRLQTDAAMSRVAGLLPPEMRGVYRDPQPEWETWLRPVHP